MPRATSAALAARADGARWCRRASRARRSAMSMPGLPPTPVSMPGTIKSMKVEGAYQFPGQPQQVWDLLLDPESLRTCIPGVESLTETAPDHWDTVMKVGVAAIKGTYKGKVAIVEKEPPLNYTLQV